jgi:hypothetical protein
LNQGTALEWARFARERDFDLADELERAASAKMGALYFGEG